MRNRHGSIEISKVSGLFVGLPKGCLLQFSRNVAHGLGVEWTWGGESCQHLSSGHTAFSLTLSGLLSGLERPRPVVEPFESINWPLASHSKGFVLCSPFDPSL